MERIIKPSRLAFFLVILIALAVGYVLTLYRLQIIEGEAYYEESRNNVATVQTVTAARGSIMDRYGRVLVTNRACNNLVINDQELFYSEAMRDNDDAINAAILQLANTVVEFGDTYIDDLPITKDAPFEYTEMTDVQSTLLSAWISTNGLEEDATAVDVMAAMRSRYNIDNSYTSDETRTIAGIRYSVNVRYIVDTSDYVFAEDVSMELITTLMENGVKGFDVDTSYVREYNTAYGAHILGYTGMMDSEEYETYSKLGYPMDVQVGKSGVEYAFEDYLHGVDGEARITSTSTGIVTSTVYTKEPEPGNNVYLTIDIGLQEAAENALNSYITAENETREYDNQQLAAYGGSEDDMMQLITGGAVVAVDVETGEPLAIASWPTYDPATILEQYEEITQSENDPLYNRALLGTYAPGSTIKPVTAIAALDLGKITLNTTIECLGRFMKYADADAGGYAPNCWIYTQNGITHGLLTVSQAITVSCNYFFYEVGDMMDIDDLEAYAKQFGLGQSTGIELGESLGNMSSRETHRQLMDIDWYSGDMLQASIGQSDSIFTPLQLAEYCAVLANGGTRHTASILKTVRSYDYTQTIYNRQAEVLSVVDTAPEYFEAIKLGMYGVSNDEVNNATVYNAFAGAGYTVAAKTGTAQLGDRQTNNAAFICYAPYDNPEIAVAVVIEKGSSGSYMAEVARSVLDYYFSFKNSAASLDAEGQLLR